MDGRGGDSFAHCVLFFRVRAEARGDGKREKSPRRAAAVYRRHPSRRRTCRATVQLYGAVSRPRRSPRLERRLSLALLRGSTVPPAQTQF